VWRRICSFVQFCGWKVKKYNFCLSDWDVGLRPSLFGANLIFIAMDWDFFFKSSVQYSKMINAHRVYVKMKRESVSVFLILLVCEDVFIALCSFVVGKVKKYNFCLSYWDVGLRPLLFGANLKFIAIESSVQYSKMINLF